MPRRTLEGLVELGKKFTTEEMLMKKIPFVELIWLCSICFLFKQPSFEYYKEKTGKKSMTEIEVQRMTLTNFVESTAEYLGMAREEASKVFRTFIKVSEQDLIEELKE